MASVQRISPLLMFDGPVEEAAKFYVSVCAGPLSLRSGSRKSQPRLPAMLKMKKILVADPERAFND